MTYGPYRVPSDYLTPEATSDERIAEARLQRAAFEALMTAAERAAQERADARQRLYEAGLVD